MAFSSVSGSGNVPEQTSRKTDPNVMHLKLGAIRKATRREKQESLLNVLFWADRNGLAAPEVREILLSIYGPAWQEIALSLKAGGTDA